MCRPNLSLASFWLRAGSLLCCFMLLHCLLTGVLFKSGALDLLCSTTSLPLNCVTGFPMLCGGSLVSGSEEKNNPWKMWNGNYSYECKVLANLPGIGWKRKKGQSHEPCGPSPPELTVFTCV